jgi:aldose 1-epimerase
MRTTDAATTLCLPGSDARLRLHPECGGWVESLVLELHGSPVELLCPNPRGHGPPSKASDHDRCFDPFFAGRFLWPFNDRIPGGRYALDGNEYRLPVNDAESGDAIHGVLYRRPMVLDCTAPPDATDDRVGVTLSKRLSHDEYPGYPFEAALEIGLGLRRTSLDLTMTTRNTGATKMPVAFGWHPYFQLPGAGTADDLRLRTNATHHVPVDDRLLPLSGPAPIGPSACGRFCRGTPARIGDLELDTAVAGDRVEIRTELSTSLCTLSIEQSAAIPYQQWFIPPSRNSIAIEPITAATDSFNRPEVGRRYLEPNEIMSASVRLVLR